MFCLCIVYFVLFHFELCFCHITFRIEPNEFGATAPPDPEVVVGTGQRCSPHDRQLCGDGRPGPEATLWHPKGLTFGLDGSLYFADGNLIRVLDNMGIVRTVAGQMLATKLSQTFTLSSPPTTSTETSSDAILTKSSPPKASMSSKESPLLEPSLSSSKSSTSSIDCGKARLATQVSPNTGYYLSV